jgi:hypothetical protein
VTYDHVTEAYYLDAHVRAIFEAHAGEIRACYIKALDAAPTLEGELEIAVIIEPDGTPSGVNAGVSYRHDDYDFRQCVDKAVESWRFGPTSGGRRGIFTIVAHVKRA